MLNVFFTDLAAYNNGYLVGEWLTLPLEEEELKARVETVLAEGADICGDEYHEECFITDWEWNDVAVFKIGEYENIYTLNDKIKMLEEEIEPYQSRVIKILMENGFADTIESAIEKIDDVIVYHDSTMTDIAEAFMSEFIDLHKCPPLIVSHIDYEGIGRDLEIEGSFVKEGTDIFEILC